MQSTGTAQQRMDRVIKGDGPNEFMNEIFGSFSSTVQPISCTVVPLHIITSLDMHCRLPSRLELVGVIRCENGGNKTTVLICCTQTIK